MPQIIDRASEDALSVLFDSDFMDQIKLHLGFDPDTQELDLPVSISSLLAEAVSVCESEQWRFIRRKPVTMLLPYEAFSETDAMLFLPYGPATSLTTFSFTDVDGASNNVASGDYTLYAGEPLKLWSEDWAASFSNIDTDLPYPITITYTTGYSTFAAIPPHTIRALKVLCYHMFEFRESITTGNVSIIPQGYEYHRDLGLLNCHRAIKYTAEDYSKVGR